MLVQHRYDVLWLFAPITERMPLHSLSKDAPGSFEHLHHLVCNSLISPARRLEILERFELMEEPTDISIQPCCIGCHCTKLVFTYYLCNECLRNRDAIFPFSIDRLADELEILRHMNRIYSNFKSKPLDKASHPAILDAQ